MSATYRILDLDNCIADDAWRIPRIQWQCTGDRRYWDYHQLAAFDQVANFDLLGTKEQLIIFTGRPTPFRALTEEWLKRHSIPVKFMLTRNHGDTRPSVQLKLTQLNQLISGDYGIQLDQITSAFDDRPEIVEMYRKFGINAEVRACHNVCAYTDPRTKELHV